MVLEIRIIKVSIMCFASTILAISHRNSIQTLGNKKRICKFTYVETEKQPCRKVP